MFGYRYAQRLLTSELRLPELRDLSRAPYSQPDFVIHQSSEPLYAEQVATDWQHDFPAPDGSLFMRCVRLHGGYALRLPGVVDALAQANGNIRLWQHPDASDASVRHALLDHILPRLIVQQGHFVLHGSAVHTRTHRTLVLLGNSGMGKSTLASAFACDGGAVLSDDSVVLEASEPRIRAIAGYPGLRLWPDSLNALFAHRMGESTPMSHYNDKRRLPQTNQAEPQDLQPIDAILVLQPPSSHSGIAIEPLTANAACMAMMRNSFQLDLGNQANVQRLLAIAARAASEIPVLALTYPREYAYLPKVVDALNRPT